MATQVERVERATETDKSEADESEELEAAEREEEDEEERERIAEMQRLEAGELGGASEYSLEEAGRVERGTTHRHARGVPPERLTPDPDPAELGRRFLENATEGPADRREDEEEPVVLPSDERE